MIDDVRRQVLGTFLGARDDRVELDLEVDKADCWEAGVAAVGEVFATKC